MQAMTVQCPGCKKSFPLDEGMAHQMQEELRKEYEIKFQNEQKTLQDEKKKVQERKDQVEQRIKEAKEKLDQDREKLNQEVENRVKEEKIKLEEEAQKRALASVEIQLKDLRIQKEENEQKIREAGQSELNLRKEKREMEERLQNLELENVRKLDAEREKIRQEAAEKAQEAHRLKDLEKDKLIQDLKSQAEEFKRRAEQGSQQLQGEILELELESLLKSSFPHDLIEPVGKGIRGADIIQKVFNMTGQECGTIVWESKNTKTWQDGWIQKLKDDQREIQAEVAVLITSILPKGSKNFHQINGVWVSNSDCFLGLAHVLRVKLIEIHKARQSSIGKGEKMEALYDYMAGPGFHQRISSFIEVFLNMKKELAAERIAMEKIWARREKQIGRISENMARLGGEIEGIMGADVPQIEALELKALPFPQEDALEA